MKSYLALGDSYTVGEAVAQSDSFPYQLSKKINTLTPEIIAKTGWRTDELIEAINNRQLHQFDYVSLLIGVNNQYQHKDINIFVSEFEILLLKAISLTKTEGKTFCLSIPDYGFTPFGMEKQNEITKDIDTYNLICEEICKKHQIPFVYITDISRKGIEQPTLVANDELHISAQGYLLFVNRIIEHLL